MIKGIGIDTVDILEMKRYIEQSDNTFTKRTFTEMEVRISKEKCNQAEYLAGRFAAKEAVFKAIAHLTKNKTFDLRIVETLNHEDGCPYIHVNEHLSCILEEAGVENLHISITAENQYASAFVIAEAKDMLN